MGVLKARMRAPDQAARTATQQMPPGVATGAQDRRPLRRFLGAPQARDRAVLAGQASAAMARVENPPPPTPDPGRRAAVPVPGLSRGPARS